MKKSIQEQITSDNGIANIIHALQTKWFGTQWFGNGITYEGITWLDSNDISKPTEAEIDAEIVKIQAEYDSLEYARGRETEYPTIGELTIALYDSDDKVALDEKRAAVKAKWPKDNSGGKYGLGEDGSPIEPEMFP